MCKLRGLHHSWMLHFPIPSNSTRPLSPKRREEWDKCVSSQCTRTSINPSGNKDQVPNLSSYNENKKKTDLVWKKAWNSNIAFRIFFRLEKTRQYRAILFVWFKTRPLSFSCSWVHGGNRHGMVSECLHSAAGATSYQVINHRTHTSLVSNPCYFISPPASFLPTPSMEPKASFPLLIHYLGRTESANTLKTLQKTGNATLHCCSSTYNMRVQASSYPSYF